MATMPEAKNQVTRQNGHDTSSSASRKEISHARRGMFRTAIGDALAVVDVSRGEVAQSLGVTEAAVSYWLAGQRVPDPDTVFALERRLGCAPGELSRHLGYVPAEAHNTPQDVVAAVQACGLSLESKERVIDLYRFLRHHEEDTARLVAELETATHEIEVKSRRRPASSDGAPGPPARSV
jgi:transcriptional regulator with XRE-family HTH domain